MQTIRTTAIIAAALLAGGCARIAAPSIDYAGPTPSVDIRATGADALFGRFAGGLTVSAVSLQHQGQPTQVGVPMVAGTRAGVTTVRLSAVPTFSVGDTLNVTWSGRASTLIGTSYVVTQSAQYQIRTAALVVQTPWGGMGPGATGKVCVALLPNAPTDLTVTLASTAVAVPPAALAIAAGQSQAAAAASATMGDFSCPLPEAAGASAAARTPACDGSNGVAATANLNGVAIHGCGSTARTCCGVNGHSCAGAAAPPASVCP